MGLKKQLYGLGMKICGLRKILGGVEEVVVVGYETVGWRRLYGLGMKL